MKTIIALLFLVIPYSVSALPDSVQDKYLKCDCHLTPGLQKPIPIIKDPSEEIEKPKPKLGPSTIIKEDTKKLPDKPKSSVKKKKKKKQSQLSTTTDNTIPYPGRDKIIPSNKLALPAGKAVYAEGQLVFLSGRLLDENCVPISDAVIDIWQVDPNGKFIKSKLSDRLSPYPHFTGTGRAVTDNLGRYNFVTLFPGVLNSSRAPHIQFHIAHKDFGILETEMYFSNEKRNSHDSKFSLLSPEDRALLLAKVRKYNGSGLETGLAVQWDISMKGKNIYRQF